METITQLQKEDIKDLIDLIIAYKKSQNTNVENQKAYITTLFEDVLKSDNSHVYVYTIDDKPVGYINVHVINFPMLNGKELYISDLLVSEKKRGKGIGKKLLDYVEDHYHQIGCTRLMLNNSKLSEGYIRGFYKKNGYTERTGFANFVKSLT